MARTCAKAGVSDVRSGHGREVYFDYALVTRELLEGYFGGRLAKIDIGAHSLPLFKYLGEIDVGNKIGDVKDRAR